MQYSQKIQNPKEVFLNYTVPDHLEGIRNIKTLRDSDLTQLKTELENKGSSLKDKISDKTIWRMGFPGMVLDVKEIKTGDDVYLEVSPIHPHRADLAFKNDKTLERNACPLTATGILISKEGYIVLGIRGGIVETGKVGVIPGGHIEYVFPRVQSTKPGFLAEFKEELGYSFDNTNLPIIGVHNNKDTKGINVLYLAQTALSFEKIEEKWKAAKDRDEHNQLLKLKKDQVEELALTGKLSIQDKNLTTTPFFQDCLKHFLAFQ
jgi:hypothetical protein